MPFAAFVERKLCKISIGGKKPSCLRVKPKAGTFFGKFGTVRSQSAGSWPQPFCVRKESKKVIFIWPPSDSASGPMYVKKGLRDR